MGLIDDDGIISAQVAIALGFSQQDPVGHDFDIGIPGCALLKPNFIPDRLTGFLPQFFSDATGNRRGGNPARLSASDDAIDSPAGRQAKFGQLGRLAGPGLAGDHDNWMAFDGSDDFVFFGKNR